MKAKTSRLTKNLIDMGKDLRDVGLIDEGSFEKITMRLLKKEKMPKIKSITSDEIRPIREKEQVSQAVFANYLNLTLGYISKLERGLKKPTGSLLTLLNIVQRKGLHAIF
jgi:putative transcriptional regulator